MRVFIFLFLFYFQVFASVQLISPNYFIKGEPFIFKYDVSGNNIKFPKIDKIESYVVQNLGTSRSIQVINGNYSEKISKKYKIVPNKSFTIPSFTFKIDGKEVNTSSKKILEKKVTKTISSNYKLDLISSKKDLYVGESVLVKMIFKHKKNLPLSNSNLEKPNFENFWQKNLKNSYSKYEENGYIIESLSFLLSPQKSGKLTINPLKIQISLLQSDPFNNFGFFPQSGKVKTIYSNSLDFNVKPLPKNVSLIGNFDIKGKIDKNSVNQGESVSYTLTIKGQGNFDDIEDIKLNIPNTLVYDNKPTISTNYINNENQGEYKKVFSIVPNSSFTIPSIKIQYFDKKLKKVISKQTNKFNIKVKSLKNNIHKLEKQNTSINKNTFFKDKKIVKKISIEDKILYFSLGFFVCLLLFLIYFIFRKFKYKKTKVETSLITNVKKAKTNDELLKIIVPYIKTNAKLDKLIFKCENNEDIKKLKKELIELLKELNI